MLENIQVSLVRSSIPLAQQAQLMRRFGMRSRQTKSRPAHYLQVRFSTRVGVPEYIQAVAHGGANPKAPNPQARTQLRTQKSKVNLSEGVFRTSGGSVFADVSGRCFWFHPPKETDFGCPPEPKVLRSPFAIRGPREREPAPHALPFLSCEIGGGARRLLHAPLGFSEAFCFFLGKKGCSAFF